MALERRGGAVYYYTSERVGRCVVKRYRGSGPVAVAIAQLDALQRDSRKFDRLDHHDDDQRRRRRLENLRRWFRRAAGVVADAMRAAGWHQHNREWRRKRGTAVNALATTSGATTSWLGSDLLKAAGGLDKDTAENAAKGDRSVTPAVSQFLANPAAVALWGDMGRRVLQRWASLYAGPCLATEMALLRFAAGLRDRLTGPDPDALVRLVAERVVVARVALNHFENQYARQADRLTVPQSKFHLARIDLCHRNLMTAARTLAKVRRARLPDVLAVVNVTPPGGEGVSPAERVAPVE